MVHLIFIGVDGGDGTGYLDYAPFCWGEHFFAFFVPTWIIERNGDREGGDPVKPIVRIWKCGEIVLGLRTR